MSSPSAKTGQELDIASGILSSCFLIVESPVEHVDSSHVRINFIVSNLKWDAWIRGIFLYFRRLTKARNKCFDIFKFLFSSFTFILSNFQHGFVWDRRAFLPQQTLYNLVAIDYNRWLKVLG